MSTQQQVFDLIKTFTEHQAILATPYLFVKMFGFKTAHFLSQLLYWSDKGARDDGFFWKTDAEWTEETGITTYGIRQARKKLEGMGIIETKVMRAMGSPTVHYRLNEEALTEAVLQQMEIAKTQKRQSEESKPVESQNPFCETAESITKTTSNKLPQKKERAPATQSQKPSRVSAGSRKQPDVPLPVAVFRSETNYYPPKSWFRDLERKVTDLDRWREIVHKWVGCGFNPRNVGGMFECYTENRLPTTKGAKNESRSRGVQPQQADPETVAAVQAHFAAKRRAAELEGVRPGAGAPG